MRKTLLTNEVENELIKNSEIRWIPIGIPIEFDMYTKTMAVFCSSNGESVDRFFIMDLDNVDMSIESEENNYLSYYLNEDINGILVTNEEFEILVLVLILINKFRNIVNYDFIPGDFRCVKPCDKNLKQSLMIDLDSYVTSCRNYLDPEKCYNSNRDSFYRFLLDLVERFKYMN
jgi:hypothetical protein